MYNADYNYANNKTVSLLAKIPVFSSQTLSHWIKDSKQVPSKKATATFQIKGSNTYIKFNLTIQV